MLRLDAADDTGEAIMEMYFALLFDCKAVTRLRGGGGGGWWWKLIYLSRAKKRCDFLVYRSFSRDVITFQNLKLKIHQSFYPHQAKEVAYLYLFTILQLNSLLRFETRAF